VSIAPRPARTHLLWAPLAAAPVIVALVITAAHTLGPGVAAQLADGPWARWVQVLGGSSARGAAPGSLARVVAAVVDINTRYTRLREIGAGTGIVIDAEGLVLTNNHVVDGASAITATDVGNHRSYPVSVLGRDRSHDIALIQLTGATALATAPLGDSSTVAVGERVMAVGNAGGRGGTPSRVAGNVTALNQTITAADDVTKRAERLTGMIAVAARVRPGDSGGPLVNSAGQVVGIDTAAGDSPTGTDGFAIPINTALQISRQWS